MTTLRVAEIATLVHGYTMNDIDRFAQAAVNIYNRYRGGGIHDSVTQREDAWYGVVERLYDRTQPPPSPYDLIFAGRMMIEVEVQRFYQSHGFNPARRETGPRFEAYWHHVGHHTSKGDFTDHVCEKLALPHLLSLLTAKQYEVIATLAVHGDVESAAKAMGITRVAFWQRLNRARRVMMEAWVAPDTPVTKKNGDETVCRNGHSRAQHGGRDDGGLLYCRICKRNGARRARANR